MDDSNSSQFSSSAAAEALRIAVRRPLTSLSAEATLKDGRTPLLIDRIGDQSGNTPRGISSRLTEEG